MLKYQQLLSSNKNLVSDFVIDGLQPKMREPKSSGTIGLNSILEMQSIRLGLECRLF